MPQATSSAAKNVLPPRSLPFLARCCVCARTESCCSAADHSVVLRALTLLSGRLTYAAGWYEVQNACIVRSVAAPLRQPQNSQGFRKLSVSIDASYYFLQLAHA